MWLVFFNKIYNFLKLSLTFFYPKGLDDVCDSNLVLKATLAGARRKDGSENYTMVLTDDLIVVNVQVSNFGEPAYDAELNIEHTPSLSFVGRKISDAEQVDCRPETGKSAKVSCSLSNPFKGKLDFQLRFNGHNIPDIEREFFITIRANT